MELLVPLLTQSKIPLYLQIYEYIKREIKNGNLQASSKLPSTRVLAEYLKVSRSTTQMSYDQLVSEGYIESIPCKGYYVARIEGVVDTGQDTETGSVLSTGIQENHQYHQYHQYHVDFSPRGIDLSSFPFSIWRKLSKHTLMDQNKDLFAAGNSQGESELRQAIGTYLHSARGVNCSPAQIVVGAGIEYLLLLLDQILGEKKSIAMEDPTYQQAYKIFKSLKYPVIPIPMDQNGMDIKILEKQDAQIAYIMPSHQYPTGVVMPVARRQELLNWAYEKEERYVIEDDYDSEFRYRGKPIPALQGMDGRNRVIYIGTFSKSVAPAIRISYMVLPGPLLERYYDTVGFYASTVSRIDQNILYQFMAEGHYERHLNRMRGVYKLKHDRLLTELKPLDGVFHITGENAGLHLLLTAQTGQREEELIQSAKEAGVKVYGLSSCYIQKNSIEESTTIILGYANLSEKEICMGAGILCKIWGKADDNYESY